jgi:hypothetical protein
VRGVVREVLMSDDTHVMMFMFMSVFICRLFGWMFCSVAAFVDIAWLYK